MSPGEYGLKPAPPPCCSPVSGVGSRATTGPSAGTAIGSQIGQQLIGRDRRPAGDRERDRRVALGVLHEVGEPDQAAVLGHHQKAALDHQVGGAGELGAAQLDRLTGLGARLDAAAGVRRRDHDLRAGEVDHLLRHAGRAGARDLSELLIVEPVEHRSRQVAVERIDEHRHLGAGDAALAVADLVAEALQARLLGREGQAAVGIDADPATRRLGGAEQLQAVAVRIPGVPEDIDAEGGALSGGDAQVGGLRRPVGLVGRRGLGAGRRAGRLRHVDLRVARLRVGHRALHASGCHAPAISRLCLPENNFARRLM